MSTGFGYDMILLLVKGLGGAHNAPARLKAPRRPRHHASPLKKRRGQHRHHHSAASWPSARARRAVVQESTAPRAEAADMAARCREGRATTLGDDAPHVLSPSTTRGGGAHGRAREVHRQIVGDGEPEQPVSRFPRAGQNVVAATMLLRNMPEPSNSQARRIRDEV